LKLDYLTLLGSERIFIKGIGHFYSPTLRMVRNIGLNTYETYMAILNLSQESIEKILQIPSNELKIFDLVINDEKIREEFSYIFSFFMSETVVYNQQQKCFLTLDLSNKEPKLIGSINSENFDFVRNVILQFNYSKLSKTDKAKPAGKHTAALQKKREKYHKKFAKQNVNKDITIPNLISKVAAYSNSVNLITIWDYTIFQLFDQFFALNNREIGDISKFNYSIWGGEQKITNWYKNTYEQ